MCCSTTVWPKTSTFPKPVTWDGSSTKRSMTWHECNDTFTKPHEIIAITSILPVSRESVCRSELTDDTLLAVYAVSTQPATESPTQVIEVCTGSKLKPEPGPYPRSSDPTRPDPSGTVKFRARTRPEITPTAHNE